MISSLLLGSSGLVGGHLLRLLLSSDRYGEVRTLVRKPMGIVHVKLRESVVDFDHLEDAADKVTADDVFCCLGSTTSSASSKEEFRKVDYTYVVEAASLSLGNGASRFFLVSAIGANPRSPFFYTRVKGEVERTIAQFPFQVACIFRPSVISGERKNRRLREQIGVAGLRALSVALVGPAKKFRLITAEDVASAMLFAAESNVTGVRIFESDEIQKMAALAS
ncbi:MAG: hypothetical protein A3C56_05160 [Ignavibacteria bacterium RIFCSPHIGHO2_02_FULL_56_12]|nr:MAG: hypothetical protein A3C56_05160 [Ignavibacteria bacterium RIFCSPHIGHO2_02_FULL_56_12]